MAAKSRQPHLAVTLVLLGALQEKSNANKMGVQLSQLKKACALAGELKNVAPNAAFQLQTQAQLGEDLKALTEDLALLAQKEENAENSDLKILAELARKQAATTAATVKDQIPKAIHAAATAATLADRIDDLARLMLVTSNTGNSQCVAGSAAFANVVIATTTLDGCTTGANNDCTLPSPEASEHTINIEAKFKEVDAAGTGISASGSACKITARHAAGGFGQASANAKLLGGLLEQSADADNEAQWKGGEANWAGSASTYKHVRETQTAFIQAIQEHSELNAKLLKLGAENEGAAEQIDIDRHAINSTFPDKPQKIQKAAAETIRKIITAYRKRVTPGKLSAKRAAFFRQQLETNITACELGAKANDKENCEVTKPQTTKCDDKKQTECGKTNGCKWNEAEGKCKLTETAQKEAEKAKQEKEGTDGKTNTNTTGSNSFAIDRAPLLLAVLLF
uniref:Variant surface glycoprotein 668 n=1 Tax=Trypanosoma brucei TaxID=5691 RepID=M4T2B0_9TRYP|nr:variant surface glycoprotein 668 [Trypanosoma brucei]